MGICINNDAICCCNTLMSTIGWDVHDLIGLYSRSINNVRHEFSRVVDGFGKIGRAPRRECARRCRGGGVQ